MFESLDDGRVIFSKQPTADFDSAQPARARNQGALEIQPVQEIT